MKYFAKKLNQIDMKLDDKIELSDLKPLWKNFERFSLYSDFRELYNKVLPEINKFETRIIQLSENMERNNEIVREFDSLISQKTNKVTT